MKKVLSKPSGQLFKTRVFHPEEIEKNIKPNASKNFAIIFTIKEALLKALGMGWNEYANFKDIIVNLKSRKEAQIKLCGKTKLLAKKMKIKRIAVDFSCGEKYVLSAVVLLK
jgi:phosphopantetheine--protein transferase-like protein